jgi:hypothetical protein
MQLQITDGTDENPGKNWSQTDSNNKQSHSTGFTTSSCNSMQLRVHNLR